MNANRSVRLGTSCILRNVVLPAKIGIDVFKRTSLPLRQGLKAMTNVAKHTLPLGERLHCISQNIRLGLVLARGKILSDLLIDVRGNLRHHSKPAATAGEVIRAFISVH